MVNGNMVVFVDDIGGYVYIGIINFYCFVWVMNIVVYLSNFVILQYDVCIFDFVIGFIGL